MGATKSRRKEKCPIYGTSKECNILSLEGLKVAKRDVRHPEKVLSKRKNSR